jgi:glycosyltransferase involved in cell wall biosynthesis
LNQTLSCFRVQESKPDEVIIVGNNLREIKVDNSAIRTFAEPTRRSPSFNRNKGAEIASGDVIIYHDVDDLPHPQKIHFIKKAFLEHDVDAFVHGFSEGTMYPYRYGDLEIERISKIKQGQYLHSDICTDGDLHHGHLSIKKDLVTKYQYNEDIYFGEDADFIKRVFLAGHHVAYGNHKLINYQPSYKTDRRWYNV